jgi:hypothetical protein
MTKRAVLVLPQRSRKFIKTKFERYEKSGGQRMSLFRVANKIPKI